MKKRIVFTGGGTAGHIMPNIALFEHFSCFEIHYIGTSGMEKEILKNYPFVTFHEIECTKLIRSLSLKNLLIPYRLTLSVGQASKILKEINPYFIFSKGGFVSLPVCIASKKLGIPLFLHESDKSIGLANRIAKNYATSLFTSFDSIKDKKAILTGSPMRKEIYLGDREKAKKLLGANENGKPFLLFVCGSCGAKSINDFVFSSLSTLLKKYNVIHLTGKNEKRKITQKDYYSLPFCSDIQHLYALSDFVISRGGANALSEIIALKKLCVCIPLSTQSRGDQIENANYYKNKGCLITLMQDDLSVYSLLYLLNQLDKNRENFVRCMNNQKVDGTKEIVENIRKTMQRIANFN